MELGTFGAILGHAIELEELAADFYQAQDPGRSGVLLQELASGSGKRRRRLLRARQELVSEMILESITGLEADDYAVDLGTQPSDGGWDSASMLLEAASARFYRDAAAKMPIREVVRLFERLARENDERYAAVASRTR